MTDISPYVLVAICLAPLTAAALSGFKPLQKALPTLGVLSVMPAVWAGYFLPEGMICTITKGHLETFLHLDALTRVFLQFTSLAWLLASGVAWFYLRDHNRRTPFWLFFLTTLTGNLLLILAGDAVSFYSGFAVMGFAAWGLVSFEGHPKAIQAGRLFLIMVVLGEALLFPGVVKAVLLAGSTDMDLIRHAWDKDVISLIAVGFLFVGFGIKAGMVPLHFWLPVAHPVAPTPASAVLSGCMIKAGLLGWMRFLPVGTDLLPELTLCFASLGTLGLIGGGLVGLFQKQVKTCLAYSTIQAAGMLMLLLAPLFSSTETTPNLILLVALYAAFHALHKTALFLAAAVFPLSSKLYIIPLALLAASYAGLPLLAGDLIKSTVTPLLDLYPASWIEYMPWILGSASLFTYLLIGKVFWMLGKSPSETKKPNPGSCIIWLLSVGVACLPPLYLAGRPKGLEIDILGIGLFAVSVVLLALLLKFEKPGKNRQKEETPSVTPKGFALTILKNSGEIIDRVENQLAGPAGALAVIALLLALIGLQVIGLK